MPRGPGIRTPVPLGAGIDGRIKNCYSVDFEGVGACSIVFRDSRESTMEFVYRWTPPDADAGDADAEDAPNDAAEDETDDENDRTDAPDRNP